MTRTAVCFDLDDTLYPYERYAAAGLRSAADWLASTTGERFHDELRALYFTEGYTETTFDRLVSRHDLPPAYVDTLVEQYHGATEPLEPYTDAESVLAQLSSAHELGVLTDGRGGRAKLDRLGLADYFAAVLVTDPIDRSKPDPVVFNRLLLALGVEPSKAVYVGDDPRVDFTAPNDLGMDTVRLRRGRYVDLEPTDPSASPDFEIERLEALLTLPVAGGLRSQDPQTAQPAPEES